MLNYLLFFLGLVGKSEEVASKHQCTLLNVGLLKISWFVSGTRHKLELIFNVTYRPEGFRVGFHNTDSLIWDINNVLTILCFLVKQEAGGRDSPQLMMEVDSLPLTWILEYQGHAGSRLLRLPGKWLTHKHAHTEEQIDVEVGRWILLF